MGQEVSWLEEVSCSTAELVRMVITGFQDTEGFGGQK